MSELSPLRLWAMRAAFAGLIFLILFFRLLPLNTAPIDLFTPDLLPVGDQSAADARLDALLTEQAPSRWIAPNFILAFAMAWGLRRPEYLPALLVAALFLTADLLLQRPPGLWAAIALIGIESVKARGPNLRDSTFLEEWFLVTVTLVSITMADRLLLAVTLVQMPPLGLSLLELAMTVIFYPVFAAITHFVMGVRKTVPGELGGLGQRI